MTTSERVELLRERRGISLTHLNNAIGAYRGKLTEVRNGKASLNDLEIATLALEHSTSTDYLLGRTDDPSPSSQNEPPQKEAEAESAEKRALYDMIDQMSEAELILLLERGKRIIESRG